MIYSTYLGGDTSDEGFGIAVNSAGDAYVTGWTFSSDFPTMNSYQEQNKSCSNSVCNPNAFLTELSSSGSELQYSTYLGGSTDDEGFGIAVDTAGNAYVTGLTKSNDFPIVSASAPQAKLTGAQNAFVAKFNPSQSGTASLIYSTYLGGGGDTGNGITVDTAGNAYIIGATNSVGFPTTTGAFQTAFLGGGASNNAFFTEINAAGTAWVYSTDLGGLPLLPTPTPISTPSATPTPLRGSASGYAIALGPATAGSKCASVPCVYLTGSAGGNFPFTAGAYRHQSPSEGETAFLTIMHPGGNGAADLQILTDLGTGSGIQGDFGGAIAIDSTGNAYVTGGASSADFPVTPTALQKMAKNGVETGFAMIVNPGGNGPPDLLVPPTWVEA